MIYSPRREPSLGRSLTSPVTVLKRRLVEQTHRIAHLEEQLAAAGNGSLFDLKHDTADDIGRVIADAFQPALNGGER